MKHLFEKGANRLREWQRRRTFAQSLRHIHGPTHLETGPQDVIVIALIRNGAYYLDAFFEHYRALGAQHFVFFDNGSTDGSLERIKAEPGTVIDASPLPLSRYEDLIRQYPAYTYGQGRWVLYADTDEIFDFLGAEKHGLDGLVGHLSQQGHTAMVAQMLEMFPQEALQQAAQWSYRDVLARFDHYETAHARWVDYDDASDIPFSYWLKDNALPDPAPRFAFGGVRGRVFGENCCMTKHPLVFMGPGVVPAPHPHCASHARVSDVQGVLKHYKFANDALGRDRKTTLDGSVDHGEDHKRLRVLGDNPNVSLMSPDALRWQGVNALYEAEFVLASDAWRSTL